MRTFLSVWLGAVALSCAVLGIACSSSSFDVGETLDAEIANADTAVFVGTTATFRATAVYDLGPGLPDSVAWRVSDPTKARLVVNVATREVNLTGLDTGAVRLYAVINRDFLDSIEVEMVENGMIRWRRSFTNAPALHPALNDSGDVHVVTLDGTLHVFDATGDTVRSVASCAGTFGPLVVTLTGHAITSGTACTQRHDSTGAVRWIAELGGFDTAPALAADDATIVLSFEQDQTAGIEAVVVSRLSDVGAPIWRDTLTTSADEVAAGSAPAITRNGDIYVTWRTPAGTSHLTRFTGPGARRWTVDLPEWAQNTTPAMDSTRVAVGFRGGLAVYDTAGGPPLWSATFPTAANVSSPIIEQNGNVYVQTVDGLFAYAADGGLRWAADSLGAAGAASASGIGAPTLLLTGHLLVSCGGDACSIDAADGSLVWRAPLADVVGSAVVDLDGQIYVTTQPAAGGGELIALWGNRLPAFNGWPTEGADQRRSRRRL